MQTKLKTTETNYAQILEEMEDAFLDAPNSKSFTVPQGGFSRPAVHRQSAEIYKRGEMLLSYYEILMVVCFSIALGAYGMLIYVHRIKEGNAIFLLIDELSKFLLMASIPIAWVTGLYLYYKKRR